MFALRSRLVSLAAAGITTAAFAAAVLGAASVNAVASPAPACGNTSLAVTHTPVQGATGHGSFVLLFRNVSHSTCTLYGYPGLDALNSTGHVLAHAQRTLHGFAGGASAVTTVSVTPGGFASATVEWLNFNPVTTGACTFSAAVATTPANTTHTVHLKVSVSICRLQVHPTVAGTSGYPGFALAQVAWIQGSSAVSSQQGLYWTHAKNDLATAGVSYSTEIAELHQLIGLPDANQTPAQNAAYHHDINALNAFFGTPGLYS